MEEEKIAYSELYEILSYMDKKQVMKVPIDILENIKNNRDMNYISKIDKEDIFNKNNVSKKTISMLAYLNLKYWVDDERKKELVNLYRENEFKQEEAKKEKYGIDEIFKKNTEKENRKPAIIKEKENFIKKIINKIKEMFKKEI